MRKFALIVAMLAMVACNGTNPVVVEVIEPLVVHPTMPSPVRPYPAKQWVYISIEDDSYYALELSKASDLVVYLEDIVRYLKAQNAIICHYREKLDEPVCSK